MIKIITFMTLFILTTSKAIALDYISSFQDNGNKVTEVRTYTTGTIETWEWLDLTVTNGISFNSIVNDLADDNLLNVSTTYKTFVRGWERDPIDNLSNEDRIGWRTVSSDEVSTMMNNYFGINMQGNIPSHEFQQNLVEATEFIILFGPTYIDGLLANNSQYFNAENEQIQLTINANGSYYTSPRRVESVRGSTNTNYNGSGDSAAVGVSVGQYLAYQQYNDHTDKINTTRLLNDNAHFWSGTWLTRQVANTETSSNEIPEPSTFLIFISGALFILLRKIY